MPPSKPDPTETHMLIRLDSSLQCNILASAAAAHTGVTYKLKTWLLAKRHITTTIRWQIAIIWKIMRIKEWSVKY